MENFSFGAFFIGLLIIIAGGAVVFFYKPISDHLVGGINSYEKVKLYGVIGIIIGFIIMTNLYKPLLDGLIKIIFPSFQG